MNIKNVSYSLIVFLFPFVTLAQNEELGALPTQLGDAIYRYGSIINSLTLIVSGLALLFFFWGLAKFILGAGDGGDKDNKGSRSEGKKLMLWGVIALFVMSAVWGIVSFLTGSILGDRPGANPSALPPPSIDSPFLDFSG